MNMTRAARHGLANCHVCGLLAVLGQANASSYCPRCGASLHLRKPDSIARTWAFILAAAILYIPANVLPIMMTDTLFGTQSDTIMSGVAYLWHTGSWPLALIVFIASVVVPMLKLMALILLLISVQTRSSWAPLQRTRLFRLVELIGKWSMLDIFVVALMVALVQLKVLASISAGPATLAFGAVVVLTMFAATSFDPRLIWDVMETDDG
jgi:paraquat-inducible protein A